MNVQQRQVEISCTGVTKGGVMTGDLHVGQGGQRRNYCIELVASGLATVDQHKIDWGEAPQVLIDSQSAAQNFIAACGVYCEGLCHNKVQKFLLHCLVQRSHQTTFYLEPGKRS